MNRIMLDLETLSSKPNALVASIGAVVFDETLGLGREFYQELTLEEQQARGRHISANTFAWWCQQSLQARMLFNRELKPALQTVTATLLDFSAFVHSVGPQGDVELWGNGSDFDNVILGGLYEAYGLPKPWSHSKNRCFRTLKNLGIGLEAGEGIERGLGAHNALADAKYQAHYAVAYLRKLK